MKWITAVYIKELFFEGLKMIDEGYLHIAQTAHL